MQTNLNFTLSRSVPIILQSKISERALTSMIMLDCHYLHKEEQYEK